MAASSAPPAEHPRCALLIVDVQRDFCPGGSLAVPTGDQIIPVINRLAGRFPVVVATRDWHPEDHVSFASRHPGRRPFETVEVSYGKQVLWPDHCVRSTSGAEFHPDLDLRAVGMVLHKGMRRDLDSYSAFLENDHSTPTALDAWLRAKDVTDVYVTGLAEDFCVRATALDAIRLGFRAYVVGDATRAVDAPAGSADRARRELREAGVTIADSRGL
jgi:nicotinamidase/pyrazinamidase